MSVPTPNEGPFGGYTDVTEVVSDPAKTDIINQVNKLKDLIPDASPDTVAGDTDDTFGYYSGVPSAKPGFDSLDPAQSIIVRNEIDALIASIEAAPTS